MNNLISKIRNLTLHQVMTILAVLGVAAGLEMVIADQKHLPVAQPITAPSVSPFKSFIAGSGILEASSDNISIGTQVNGIVDKIYVTTGEKVKKGDPLFSLDIRAAAADVALKTSQLETAKTVLDQANASLKNAQDEFNLINQVKDKRAYTKEEFITRENNVLIAKAAVSNAEASIGTAEAQLNASKVSLELYTISAPIDAEVLQSNIHIGEFAPAGLVNSPLMLLGSVVRYNARVNIDENDAWRFDKDAQAVLFLRGNVEFSTPLKFEYVEPYVIPKQTLTGDSTERVDTRVFQVVYSYDPSALPSYLGQQVDVYIEAKPMSEGVKYGGPLEISQ